MGSQEVGMGTPERSPGAEQRTGMESVRGGWRRAPTPVGIAGDAVEEVETTIRSPCCSALLSCVLLWLVE